MPGSVETVAVGLVAAHASHTNDIRAVSQPLLLYSSTSSLMSLVWENASVGNQGLQKEQEFVLYRMIIS